MTGLLCWEPWGRELGSQEALDSQGIGALTSFQREKAGEQACMPPTLPALTPQKPGIGGVPN